MVVFIAGLKIWGGGGYIFTLFHTSFFSVVTNLFPFILRLDSNIALFFLFAVITTTPAIQTTTPLPATTTLGPSKLHYNSFILILSPLNVQTY